MSSQRQLKHSQNFIRRPELVRELLELTNIGLHDLVIEIGPGKGIITRELVKKAGRVIAIERDPVLAKELSLLNTQGDFQLVVKDFLEWQLPEEPYKVFSNIPFNYTADIVSKLTNSDALPTDIYLIMQKAAAHRFAGMPHKKNTLVSTLIGIDFSVRILHKIDRDSFVPKPGVDIVFVHFSKHVNELIPDKQRLLLRDFIVYGYTQWALTVLEAFKKVFSRRQRQIISKSLNVEDLKPSDLTIEQWLELFNTFCKYTSEDKKRVVQGSEGRLSKQQTKLSKNHRTRERN